MGTRTERPAPGEQVPVARSAPGSQQAVAVLVWLPPHILQCNEVFQFFEAQPEDVSPSKE